MKNFIAILQLLATLYPILMQTIKSLEEAMPEPGQGPAKLEILKGTLEAAYLKMEKAQLKFEEVWPSIQMLVTTIVAVFNATGVFKKK